MVVPYRHTAEYGSLNPGEVAEMHRLTSISMDVIKRTMNPEGFNLGINIGKVAGAGVADHVHMHVVPRWNGDTNFMPVMGDVRVVPQSLEETYRIFKEAWPD
jgi:ATP adenylyltransferase